MSDLKDDSAAVSVINVVIFKRIGRAKPVFYCLGNVLFHG